MKILPHKQEMGTNKRELRALTTQIGRDTADFMFPPVAVAGRQHKSPAQPGPNGAMLPKIQQHQHFLETDRRRRSKRRTEKFGPILEKNFRSGLPGGRNVCSGDSGRLTSRLWCEHAAVRILAMSYCS